MKPCTRFLLSSLAAVLIAGLAACAAPATQAPAVDLQADAQAIRDISARWLELEATHDAPGILALLSDDAVFLSEGKPVRQGHAAIQAAMESEWATSPEATITWATSSVQVAAAGDMAWERGTYQYDPDGVGPAAAVPGEYVTVYQKLDGVWKVVLDTGADTQPAAATAD